MAVARWPANPPTLVAPRPPVDSLAVHVASSRVIGIGLRLYVLCWHLGDRFRTRTTRRRDSAAPTPFAVFRR
jgi:hypothetical protein